MRFRTASFTGLAALLRAPGLLTDFWLDEIWALGNATAVDSVSGVVTGIHHDSNHWLESFWMYAWGPDQPFWLYRLPSFLAGVAAVPLAGRLAERWGAPKALVMAFVATSFPLVFYSSEARGYSLAVLASFAALLFVSDWIEGRRPAALLGFWLAASIGILSHLSFLLVLAAVAVFWLVLVGRGRSTLLQLLVAFSVPVGLLALLFAADLRHLRLGGGPHVPPSTLLAQTASLAVGGPVELPDAWGFAVVGVSWIGAELFRRIRSFWGHRERSETRELLWIFYVALGAIPAWLALVLDPPFLFPRYFLVSLAFVPFLAASFTASRSRAWAVALVTLWMLSNGVSTFRFLRDGRGHYEEALRFLLERHRSGNVDLGSDEDFRNEKIVRFYRERMGEGASRLRYVRGSERAATSAEYFIAERAGSPCEHCDLLRVYPSSELSGASWYVYESASGRR